MEIKEVVGILKGLQEPEAWEPQITEKTFEALDMAIMALERSADKSRFFTLEYDFQYSIKVDRDTGVMYAVSNGNNNAGTFTPLINADGKPLIYKQIIKESDLVKMGVIEPGEIKAGQVGPIEQLKNLLEKAESEPPIIEGSVLEDLLVPVGLVREIISVQHEPPWIPCSERLPENRVCVIVCFREWQQYANRYIYSIVTGWYARKHSVRENVFSEWEADCDYDEDEDEYYIHEGWYEFTTQGNADLMNWYINAEVVAWMPLPKPFEGEPNEMQ